MQSNCISDVGGFKTLFLNFFFFAISVVKNLCVCVRRHNAHSGCIFQFQIIHLIKNKTTLLTLCNITTSSSIIQGHPGTTAFHTWLRWNQGTKQKLPPLPRWVLKTGLNNPGSILLTFKNKQIKILHPGLYTLHNVLS